MHMLLELSRHLICLMIIQREGNLKLRNYLLRDQQGGLATNPNSLAHFYLNVSP